MPTVGANLCLPAFDIELREQLHFQQVLKSDGDRKKSAAGELKT
jgi:hypothetical protein